MNPNPNCDGEHCQRRDGEVRILRIGKSPDQGNVNLCRSCFNYEISWRLRRNVALGEDFKFQIPTWDSLPISASDALKTPHHISAPA